MTAERAISRLASIPGDAGSYGEAVLTVYQYLPEGEFYRDLRELAAALSSLSARVAEVEGENARLKAAYAELRQSLGVSSSHE